MHTGWTEEHHAILDSTQRLIRERMDAEPRDRHVVAAETQSHGKGRWGSAWSSPSGGLWFSFSMIRRSPPDPWHSLLIAAAVRAACAELCGPEGDARLRLKWPNDLICAERKWGGVLCDVSSTRDGSTLLLAGVGVNLAIDPAALAALDVPATSLALEFGRSPSPREALSRILCRIDAFFGADERGARVSAVGPYLATLGSRIRWREESRTFEGTAVGLEPDGALRVRPDGGSERLLRSGEVRHLRSGGR